MRRRRHRLACMFQSAPGPKAGRKLRRPAARLEDRTVVSIRSRPEGREKATPTGSYETGAVSIRSRPEGREKASFQRAIAVRRERFNPLPARRPGERTGHASLTARSAVSIRSRPEDREKERARRRARTASRSSFNPLPARRPGETSPRASIGFRVSIRSRPEGREKASRLRPDSIDRFNPLPARRPGESASRRWLAETRFNPLPARRPGESLADASTGQRHLFQSAPGPKTGRKPTPDPTPCFNPLPARSRRRSPDSSSVFQSAPGPKTGRKPEVATSGTRARCFNPLPARRPGESDRMLGGHDESRSAFQSAPGPKAGRKRMLGDQQSRTYMFQSAPGPKAGRKHGDAGSPSLRSFQSAPGPKTGRKSPVGQSAGRAHVSIRSRPEGREKGRFDRSRSRPHSLFQSAPGPKAGRKASRFAVSQADRVSIRSRPEDREKDGLVEPSCSMEFQSAPGPKAGRNPWPVSAAASAPLSFNPLPARRPGESQTGRHRWRSGSRFQSAPGPKTGRKEPAARSAGRRATFQSAPGPKAGRKARDARETCWIARVSIRSRPEDREKGPAACCEGWPRDRFNPLPARRPGETLHVAWRRSCRAFQSAPGPKAGRKSSMVGLGALDHVSIRSRPEGREKAARLGTACVGNSFNPLPARRPGESAPSRLGRPTPDHRFNPLPARRPGERPQVQRSRPRAGLFQSAPGPKAGRKVGRIRRRLVERVSIRSRPEGREKAGRAASSSRSSRCFNPLPARRPGERKSTRG